MAKRDVNAEAQASTTPFSLRMPVADMEFLDKLSEETGYTKSSLVIYGVRHLPVDAILARSRQEESSAS